MLGQRNLYLGLGFSLALHLALPLALFKTQTLQIFDTPLLRQTTVELIDSQSQQIVDSSSINFETPDDAQFLSRHDQKVDRQTRAANTGKFSNAGGIGGDQSLENEQFKPEEVPDVQTSSEGFDISKFLPDVDFAKYARIDDAPVSATNDKLKGLDLGERTLLQTRKYLYYSYFSRIKERLKGYFEPSLVAKIRQIEKLRRYENRGQPPPRAVASIEDKITKTLITLDTKGIVLRVQILSPSGFKDLDETAVEAFQKAEQFPNPPKGLADEDGLIRIYWDFVLEA